MSTEFKNEEEMSAEELVEMQTAEEFVQNWNKESKSIKDATDEDIATLEKSVKLLATISHQKKHFREKVIDLEKKLKDAKPGDTKPTAPKEDVPAGDVIDEKYLKIELRQEGYTNEQAKKIVDAMKVAGLKTIEELQSSEIFKPFLEKMKDDDAVEDASFGKTTKPKTPLASDNFDWSKATPAQIEAHRNKVMTGQ